MSDMKKRALETVKSSPESFSAAETAYRPQSDACITASHVDGQVTALPSASVTNDGARWQGDLTAEQRAERAAFARSVLANPYASHGPVDCVVKAATHHERNGIGLPSSTSRADLDAWNARRLDYAARIVPPELGVARVVRETRRLIETIYINAGGDPDDCRGLYPGDRELTNFISACLLGGTEVAEVKHSGDGCQDVKMRRVDYGCMPLYKRDFNRSMRAQVPVELQMKVFACCELWRAEAAGEPYVFLIDGQEGQGFLTQRDHGADGPYRRIKEPVGPNEAGPEVMAMISRYTDGVGQRSAVAFYQDLCLIAPHRDALDVDPALVPLGSGYLFDPRTKRARPMSDDDVFVGCMAGLTWDVNDDGTIVPVRKPLFCADGEVVYSEAEAADHGGVALDPERYLKDIQPTEDGQNALCDVTQAAATPRMPRDKAPLFVGAPRAGKGTTLKLLRNAFGNKVQQARTTTIMNMAQFADRTFNVAARGKLLVYSDEESTGGYIEDCAPFKAFVSHDPYATRDLFGHKTSVTSVGMFIGCMNDFVGFSDKGRAMIGRLFIVPFRISHLGSEDRRIKDWMADPRTVNWWFYHVLVELPFHPEFRENDLTRAAKGEYQLTIDPVRQFFEEEIKPKVGDFTPNALLYAMFTVWYKRVNSSRRVLSMKKFVSTLADIVADDPDFIYPREKDAPDGSRGGLVRLVASRFFDLKQAEGYLHDPTIYCTCRIGYGDAKIWLPPELDAWCDCSNVVKLGQVRGWLVRTEAWQTFGETGSTPAEIADQRKREQAQAKREAEEADKHTESETERAKWQQEIAKAEAAKRAEAHAKRLKKYDSDGYYQWFCDSVEIANEEFGGYRIPSCADELHEPLSRDEWRERDCPFELDSHGTISTNHVMRKAYGTDAAFAHFLENAGPCLERDGLIAFGGSLEDLSDNDVTVLLSLPSRETWLTLGTPVDRIRRVRLANGRAAWLFGPAELAAFAEPSPDKSPEAFNRYREFAAKNAYAVNDCTSWNNPRTVELDGILSYKQWARLGYPSEVVRDVEVDGRTLPLLGPAMRAGDEEYMKVRLKHRAKAVDNEMPDTPPDASKHGSMGVSHMSPTH